MARTIVITLHPTKWKKIYGEKKKMLITHRKERLDDDADDEKAKQQVVFLLGNTIARDSQVQTT